MVKTEGLTFEVRMINVLASLRGVYAERNMCNLSKPHVLKVIFANTSPMMSSEG